MPHSARKNKASASPTFRAAATAASPRPAPFFRMGSHAEDRQRTSESEAHVDDDAATAVVLPEEDLSGKRRDGLGHDKGRTRDVGMSSQEANAPQKGDKRWESSREGFGGESIRQSQRQVSQPKAGSRKQKKANTSSQAVRHSQGLGWGGGMVRRSLAVASVSGPRTHVGDDGVFDFDDAELAHSTQQSEAAPAAHTAAGDQNGGAGQEARAIERSARRHLSKAAEGSEAGGSDGGRSGVRAMFAFSMPSQPQAVAKGSKGGNKVGARKGGQGSQCSRGTNFRASQSQPLTLRQRLAAAPHVQQMVGKQQAQVVDAIADFSDDDDAFSASASVVCGDRNGGLGASRLRVGMGGDERAAEAADLGQNSPGKATQSGVVSWGAGAGGAEDDLQSDGGDSQLPVKTPSRSFFKEMGALAQTTPMWNTNVKQRNKRSRSKGELGKMLERHLLEHEQDMKLFEHARQASSAHNSSDAGLAEGATSSFASAMRWFAAVIVEEHREANLHLCVCRVVAPDGPRYLHVLWPSLVFKLVPKMAVGCVVKLFAPWDQLVLSVSGTQMVLASERCEVAQVLDLETMSLPQVDQVLTQLPAGLLPKEVTKEPIDLQLHASSSVQRLPISSFPFVNLRVSDGSTQQENIILIKNLDVWMATATLQGSVLRSFPRGVLIKDCTLDPLQHECKRPHLSYCLDVQEKLIKAHPPMFFIADSTGIVAVKVPEDLAHLWLPVLLGPQGALVEYSFSKLGFASAKGGVELKAAIRLRFATPEGDQLPMSPIILLVTPRSSFQILPTLGASPVLAADWRRSDCRLLSSREVLLDVMAPSHHRNHGIGIDEEKKLERATVMVTVDHIATPPSAAWSKDSRQMLLCVRDESLAPAGIQNVLLVITDYSQMLASAALLEEGDIILIWDAIVCPSAHCSGKPPFPRNVQTHSTLGSLRIDDMAFIARVCADNNDSGAGGRESGMHVATHVRKQHVYDEAEGCLLPRVFVEKKHLSALQAMESGVERRGMLPVLSQQMSDTSSWLMFAGMIVSMGNVKTRSACPYCRAQELQELMPDEESASLDSSSCSDRVLCLSCQKIFTVSA
jgi:hypothetical protein